MSIKKKPPFRYYQQVIPVVICIAALSVSCNKGLQEAPAAPAPVETKTVSNNMLVFNSMDGFRNCMKDLVATGLESAPSVIERYQGKQRGFVSAYQARKAVQTGNTAMADIGGGGEGPDIPSDQPNPDDPQEPQDPGNVDIPDPYIESVLNNQNEVQIENTIYKITEYGVFICMPAKLERVYAIIDSLDGLEAPPDARASARDVENPGPGENEELIANEEYVTDELSYVQSGIYRFEDPAVNTSVYGSGLPLISDAPGGGTWNPPVPDPNALPQAVYNGLPTFDFNAQTFVGQLLQTLFGRTKAHFQNFDNSHRVKVNFYNVNFGFYASVGINVKMQTKGWTGIWRKLDTEQLRLGWDGLIIDFTMPNMPAPTIPQIGTGDLKLGDVSFPVHTITVAGQTITQQKIRDALNGLWQDAVDNTYNGMIKKVWDYVTSTLAPGQYATRKDYVSAFRVVYPDKVKMVFGRYETIAHNTNEITKNFDWNAGFTFKWNGEGKAIEVQNFKANSYKYNIQSGSIYGMAKYGGVWKGARIDKR
jgi:hypothetical protein